MGNKYIPFIYKNKFDSGGDLAIIRITQIKKGGQ